MHADELPQRSEPKSRGDVCVVIAAAGAPEQIARCVESVQAHNPLGGPPIAVAPITAEVNRALEQLSPADVVVLTEACLVGDGWLERLRIAARADTNTATASALAD